MKLIFSATHDQMSGRALRGFSLIELMIAITLGLLLTAGVIQLFSATKVTFNTNDAQARMQENGRFALETLKRQLRAAATLGYCAGQADIRNHLNTGCPGGIDDFFNPDFAVVGWEYGGTGLGQPFTLPEDLDPSAVDPNDWNSASANSVDLPSQLSGQVVPGSDVLVTRNLVVVDHFTADPANPHKVNEDITLTAASNLEDTVLLITDCSKADLFQNMAGPTDSKLSSSGGSCASPGPGNNSLDWSTTYKDEMQTFTVEQVAYYIGVNNAGEPGLYRWNMTTGTAGAQAEEIIEGAENMQVLYGFSRAAPQGDGQHVKNGDWLDANQIPAGGWPQVIAIRLALSVRSSARADLNNTNITLDLASTNITAPGDGRIRQPFSTTVALRNRVRVIDQ